MNNLKDKLNFKKLNEAIITGNKILKLLYTLLIIILVYALTLIIKEWGILQVFFSILKILFPFFLGYVLAWLLNPVVNKLEKKKIKRTLSVFIVYLTILVVMSLFLWAIIPPLITQITDTSKSLTVLVSGNTDLLSNFVDKMDPEGTFGLAAIEQDLYISLTDYFTKLGTNLPETIITIVASFMKGMGTILIGFVIGFYMLFNFNNVTAHIMNLLPKKHKNSIEELIKRTSSTLNSYIKGILTVSSLLSLLCLIAFSIMGLKSPLLFALLVGVTNVIPYIGPYIGGIPAVFVGFSQDPVIGLLVVVFLVILQTIEGNVLTPMVMSKKLDIHPVTIIIMLLLFGYFFGIIGMIFATPVAAIIKVFYDFFNQKYDFFDHNEKSVIKEKKVS